MPRATCRCGEPLNSPPDGSGRIVCPKCGARVKIRSATNGPAPTTDGFIRFFCPCGRRLKVSASKPPTHGKCPDCGRVVPVPAAATPTGHPEALTEELRPTDLALLDRWAQSHLGAADSGSSPTPVVPQAALPVSQPSGTDRAEVGLRVCPNCGKPVHLGADACRSCGTPVPRR